MLVCLFDIDGTLISSGGAGKAALEAALASAFGVEPNSQGISYSGRTDRAIVRDLFQAHALADSADNLDRLLTHYLSHLPGCLARGRGQVLPGIAALLERLRARQDVAVGLLTGNVREGARVKLGHFNLHHHFPFGGFGDCHLDRCDVAVEALRAAHAHLNGAGGVREVWVVGDTPLDIACARAIGAKVAAVATGWHTLTELADNEPNLVLHDLGDPAPLMKACGLI